MRSRAWIAFVVAAACSKSSSDGAAPASARPANVTDEMVAIADRYVGAMAKMADDMKAAGTDCAKVAAAVRARSDEARPMLADINKLVDTVMAEASSKAWFDTTYSPRMKAVGEKLRPVVDACRDSRELGAAMEESFLVPKRKKSAR